MAYTYWRVSPTATSLNPMTITGTTRKYTATLGSFLDVPDFDAAQLVMAGWIRLDQSGASAGVGTTANRPSGTPTKGTSYLDTTVGAKLVADGKGNWLHHVTGAAS